MIEQSKLTQKQGYLEGDSATLAPDLGQAVTDYKQQVVKRYLSLNPEQLEHRLGGTTFQVTRKLDGELAVIFFDGKTAFTINTGGRIRTGLPAHEAAAKCLRAAGLSTAVIPAELYLAEGDGRTRVFDVAAALADPDQHAALRLAPFEIVSLNGDPDSSDSYTQTHAKLVEIFTAELVRPVPMKQASSKAEVAAILHEWVETEGAEGLVVRCDLPVVYKIKPVYTLDVAVIGYSENPDVAGQVRSLLVALACEDGRYQPIGHVGSGLNDALRTELFDRLSPTECASSYIETDTNHVAFHMVQPLLAIEIRVNDVIFETSSGTLLTPLLEFDKGWSRTGTSAGISIIHPVLARLRDDKTAAGVDVRLAQIEEYWSWPVPPQTGDSGPLPKSSVLRRDVFTKTTGGKLMVQKFLVWQTNKTDLGYPAYVLAYSNFSSGRAEPLTSDVRVSSSEEQILELAEALIADKVKGGWAKVEPV